MHSVLTTHLIISGSLTITYPDDPEPTKQTVGLGERLDIAADRKHEVWISNQGCTSTIGEA